MCGIAGVLDLRLNAIPALRERLAVMNDLQAHRGPDGEGMWLHPNSHVGFAHRRLSIIDLSTNGRQPMTDGRNWVTFNGEVYNFLELKAELGREQFTTRSDTEVILHAYRRWKSECVQHFRGMFAFALWDEESTSLFCARDRFGIKPFYYTLVDNTFYFSSEVKALLPYVREIATDTEALKEYLAFQFCLDGKTLFEGIHELPPGHTLRIHNGTLEVKRYWEIFYHLDMDHTERYFEEHLRTLFNESVALHRRSDVPLGAYVSGGIDSSVIASLASRESFGTFMGFTGKFSEGKEYDETPFARVLADWCGFPLHQIVITAQDFIEHIRSVIYHLDYPVAGPGAFPQFMVSCLASQHRKVLLGGQGGDEIFGGYTRYLMAYFEQCIKAAIDGTMHNGNFVVTYESIIPNLESLRPYTPMLKEFWREGLFEDIDRRYYRLINRAPSLGPEIRWDMLGPYSPFETFRKIFYGHNVGRQSYFDLMTHFDLKTLLPALLQIEDRMSMAHGIESRVPLLDHPLVEFAATIPAMVKFKNGTLKNVFKNAFHSYLPEVIAQRKDKMGFPTPLTEWIHGDAREFIHEVFSSQAALTRSFVDNWQVLQLLDREPKFGRSVWGLLCLELWHQEFHDRSHYFRTLLPRIHQKSSPHEAGAFVLQENDAHH